MKASHILPSLLHWILGLTGVLALMVVLSFLPALFGFENPELVFISLGGIVLSKGILEFFSYPFAISVMVLATALFVWVCLLFSMSSHTLVEQIVRFLNDDRVEGVTTAWLVVLLSNFLLVSFYVYILFGTILTPATLLIGALMLVAMAALLAANYQETSTV